MQQKHLEEADAVPLFSVSTCEEHIFDGWHLSSIDNRCCLSPVSIVGRSSIVVSPSLPSRKSLRGRESEGFNRIRINPTPETEEIRNYRVKVLWPHCATYTAPPRIFVWLGSVHTRIKSRPIMHCVPISNNFILSRKQSVAYRGGFNPHPPPRNCEGPPKSCQTRLFHFVKEAVSGVPRGFNPLHPRNSEGPPKSCQNQPDFENC